MKPAIRKLHRLFSKLQLPWSQHQICFRFGWLLCPFFGSKIVCRKCGAPIARGIPVFWKGRLYLLSKDRARYRYCPEGPFAMAFECVPSCGKLKFPDGNASIDHAPSNHEQEEPTGEGSLLHLVLAHQAPDCVQKILSRLAKMGPGYTHLLIYGGPESDFKQINFPNKVFCPDSSLRGLTMYQSYSSALQSAFTFWSEKFASVKPEWVLFTESDVLPLRPNYASSAIRALSRSQADFGAVGLDNVTSTNDTHLHRALTEGNLVGEVRQLTGRRPVRFFHALGALTIFKWDVFEAFCRLSHREVNCYLEIYLPTVLETMGFRGVNLAQIDVQFSGVRYRPEYTREELENAIRSGASFAHPVKNHFQLADPLDRDA